MSNVKYLEMEDVAYKEWSDHLDYVASTRPSPWLPAYGYHGTSTIQEIFQPDPFLTDNSSVGQQQYLVLETIVEETSDDLRSESDKSGPIGWNSDSDTDSVIHKPKKSECGHDWKGHDYTDEMPKAKRRRRILEKFSYSDDDEPQENLESTSLSSRSSSLIAFESLEKHCEDIFVTTASADPFGGEAGRWNQEVSQDSSGEDSTGSSDEENGFDSSADTLHRSHSSRGSFRSFPSGDARIRPYRSFDSLNLFDDPSSLSHAVPELSQSQSALDLEKAREEEKEEFLVRDKKLTATTADLSTMSDTFESFIPKNSFRKRQDIASFHYKKRNRGFSPFGDGERKVNNVFFASERKSYSAEILEPSPSAEGDVKEMPLEGHVTSEPCLRLPPSAESLSEDSGFDDHISGKEKTNASNRNWVSSSTEEDSSPTESSSSYYSGSEEGSMVLTEGREHSKSVNKNFGSLKINERREAETKGSATSEDDVEVKYNPGRSQTHMFNCTGERGGPFERGEIEEIIATPVTFASLEESNGSLCDSDIRPRPEFITFCKKPIADKRNDGDLKRNLFFDDSLVKTNDFYDAMEKKNHAELARQTANRLMSTPNLFVSDDDFVRTVPSAASSLTHVPLNDETDSGTRNLIDFRACGGSQSSTGIKGVHFCPVVSEVSWQDNYNEEEEEEETSSVVSEASTDELSNRSLEEICAMENDDEEFHEVEEKLIPRVAANVAVGRPTDARRFEDERVDGKPSNVNAMPDETEPHVDKKPVPPTVNVTPTSSGHVVVSDGNAERRTRLSVSESSLPVEGHASENRREKEFHSSSSCADATGMTTKKAKSRLGGFFERFSFRRLSNRKSSGGTSKKQKEDKKGTGGVSVGATLRHGNSPEDVTIIPLRGPENEAEVKEIVRSVVTPHVVSAKPPLPPSVPRMAGASRRRSPSAGTASVGLQDEGANGNEGMPGVEAKVPTGKDREGLTEEVDSDAEPLPKPVGLLETDLDTHVTVESSGRRPLTPQSNVAANKKARSLMNLGLGDMSVHQEQGKDVPSTYLEPSSHRSHGSVAVDDRAKSMEFLLDKENQASVLPPENELQKGGTGERVMSEHQLRVQRSLQKLNIPDWYKSSAVSQTPQGFLLKSRRENQGWPGLGSKTTSLSSLGSSLSATARSPTSHVLSPSPTPHLFTRWSTSRLNSGFNSSSTSPSGSARSSFNYRQPYLGWRSQEKLTRPRTPAERLAAGLLPLQKQQATAQSNSQCSVNQNLSDVRTSIKEVTSAIVHYVSGVQENGSREGLRSRHPSPSPSPKWQSSSPRGSSGKLCWLESSFVGSRPLDQPETPLSLSEPPSMKPETRSADLYLDLKPHQEINHVAPHRLNEGTPMGDELRFEVRSRPSPSSTTLDDVLESLLGLPPTSRSPSPGPASLAASSPGRSRPTLTLPERQHQRHSCGDIRADVSSGSASDPGNAIFVKEVVTHRRKSDGSGDTMGVKRQGSERKKTTENGSVGKEEVVRKDVHSHLGETTVKCRYSKCGKTATVLDAKRTFKTCHNCSHVYCSRECRRAHWERHRRTCLHSRVGALCRQVLAAAKEDDKALHHLSLLARRGYLTHGRGAVKIFFSSPELAEKFVARGFDELGEPAYVKWSDLLPAEMGADLFAELVKICKSYNPDTRLVLYVAICVVSEVPTTGAVKWERQLVSRCCKIRLDKSLKIEKQVPPPLPPRRSSSDSANITREMENPETLILTSLPGIAGKVSEQKMREISFANIQRELKDRGVSLRRQFPEVYKKLCSYVEGTSDHFTPVTVYPRDAVSGKTFMCIIMPDSEPEKLELVPKDSTRVQTIDVGVERKNS